MKVLQVVPALNSGGVERGTLEIASALTAAGHTSVVISAGGQLVPSLEAAGSIHRQWDIGRKSPLTLLQVTALRRWLTAEAFDIVHLRSRMPAWIVWLAWRRMPQSSRPRLVSTVHGLHSVNRYSEIVTCGERVIAVSKAVQNYILHNYPRTDPNKIRLIYRGIDADAFPRDYRASADWQQAWHRQYSTLAEAAVITLPGRLTRLKGHAEFFQLIKLLRDRGVEVHGLVVGSEDPRRRSYAREIYQKVEQLELSDHITFAGHRTDMRDIYSVSSAVVSLSTKPEAFGRTVLEPLSMGVPVVGYAHGGVGEILESLYPQGAVSLHDLDAAANQLCAILKGQLPPVRPNREFDLHRMQAQTLELYGELLVDARPAGGGDGGKAKSQ